MLKNESEQKYPKYKDVKTEVDGECAGIPTAMGVIEGTTYHVVCT
jgi:hypothetical protein